MTTARSHDDYLKASLKNPREAALFLEAAVQENDPVLILEALSLVARAYGLSRMAKKIPISRMGLYKTLSRKGNPEFRTFLAILKASNLRLSFKPVV